MRQLLGDAAFDTLCDNVFEMMSPDAQARFLDYVGVSDINTATAEDKRAAADEYIAHLAERTDLTDAEESVWGSIVKMIRTALETLGLSISITDDVLSNLIKASYAEMVKNRRSEEAENDNEESEPNMGDAISFRVVDTENPTDFERKVLEDIETGNTQKVYRGMQVVEIDGQRYALPPMASKIEGEWAYGIKINDDNTLEPVLLQSDERPDLIGKDGKFKLDKGNGKSVPAAYNPYWHTSATMLNDQFAEAQDRPNLITVEGLISNTDLESGYKADNAKDAVGEHEWKAGTITGQLTGKRKLYLSRYFQGLRVVPDSEVAQSIYNQINGVIEYMPSNVLPPSVRTELEKLGVKFLETNNNNELLETEHKGDKYTWWYGKNQVKNRKKAFVERAKKEGMLLSEWLEKEGRTGQLPDKEVASADKALAKGSEKQGVRFSVKDNIANKEVKNVILVDTEEKKLPTTREEVFEYIPAKGLSKLNYDQNVNIRFSRKPVKPYGIGNPYQNKQKATKEQRDEIIKKIRSNKYDRVGTDIVKIGDALFLIDHMDDYSQSEIFLKNGEIPDGQGYGIRKKYNFATITKEDIHEIIRNIADEYNYSEENIRKMLQDIGFKPRNLFELNIASAIRRGNGNNDMGTLASRRRGDETHQNGSSVDSRGNQGKIFGKAESEEGVEENSEKILFRTVNSEYADKVDDLNKGIEEKGLRGHLGEVPYKKMMRTVYEGNDEIAQNVGAMLRDKEWNLYDSIETYLADEAQTMGNEEMWQDVRQSLADAVDFFPSIKDTKYAMWLNKNRDNDPSDPNDGIKRNALLLFEYLCM